MNHDPDFAAPAVVQRQPWPSFNAVARKSLLLIPVLLLARAADLVKFIVIARAFGASPAMDAFWVASSIPAGVGGLVESTAEQGFVALGTRARIAKEGSDCTLLVNLLLLALLTFWVIASLYLSCADHIVAVVGRGLPPGARATAVRLTQLLTPILLLSPIFGLLTGFHYVRDHYIFRTLTPVLGALVVALSLWWPGPRGIHSLAIAYSAAYAAQLGVLLPLVWDLRRQRTALQHPLSYYSRSLTHFLLPLLLVSTFTNLNPIVDRAVASFLAPGAISYVDYANRMGSMFSNLIVGGFVMVLYPFLAHQAAVFEASVVAREAEKAMHAMSLLMIPTLAIAIWMRLPIMVLLFERGAFTRADSIATAATFAALAPGLLFLAFNTVLTRGFYSLHNSRTPMLMAIASAAPNFLLDVLLARYWSFVGIALATSAVQGMMFLLLAWSFQHQHAPVRWRSLARDGASKIFAAGVSVAAVQWLLWRARPPEAAGLVNVIGVCLALVGYIGVSSALGIDECRRISAWCIASLAQTGMGRR